jgi:hypothetical protein
MTTNQTNQIAQTYNQTIVDQIDNQSNNLLDSWGYECKERTGHRVRVIERIFKHMLRILGNELDEFVKKVRNEHKYKIYRKKHFNDVMDLNNKMKYVRDLFNTFGYKGYMRDDIIDIVAHFNDTIEDIVECIDEMYNDRDDEHQILYDWIGVFDISDYFEYLIKDVL